MIPVNTGPWPQMQVLALQFLLNFCDSNKLHVESTEGIEKEGVYIRTRFFEGRFFIIRIT